MCNFTDNKKMNRLSKICDKSLPFIERSIPILNDLPNTTSLHNKHRLNVMNKKKSKFTFDGKYNCGGVSYLLDYYLKLYGYECTLKTKSKGLFYKRETHSFLKCGHFIIDPTYRQMFLPDYSEVENVKGDDLYHKYLYEFLPMTFIGTYHELVGMFNDLHNLHYKTYKSDLKNTLDMWQETNDESNKSDFQQVVDSLNYATEKCSCYIKLHCMMNHHKV